MGPRRPTVSAPPRWRGEPTVYGPLGREIHDEFGGLRSTKQIGSVSRLADLEPEIADYLKDECRYSQQLLAPLSESRRRIALELAAGAHASQHSPVRKNGDWLYGIRKVDDVQPQFFRRSVTTGTHEVVVDFRGCADFAATSLVSALPSSDFTHLACVYEPDKSGRNAAIFIDCGNGQLLPDRLYSVSAGGAFSPDGKTFFYAQRDRRGRRYAAMAHRLGSSQCDDEVLWIENDDKYSVSVRLSQSGQWLIVQCSSVDSTETKLIPIAKGSAPLSVGGRRMGAHVIGEVGKGSIFALVSDAPGRPFQIVSALCDLGSIADDDLRDASQFKKIETRWSGEPRNLLVLLRHVVWEQQLDGRSSVRAMELEGGRFLNFGSSPTSSFSIVGVDDFDPKHLVLRETSLALPEQLWLCDLSTGEKSPLPDLRTADTRRTKADRAPYEVRRLGRSSSERQGVPISLVGKPEALRDGAAPCLLTAYGAYGAIHRTDFNSAWVPLLERGFICAIAHIRGGGEGGQAWHEAGKREGRKLSSNDFIQAAQSLVNSRLVDARRIVAHAVSAGAVAVFGAVGRRPDLFSGLIGIAPFLDVLATMTDHSLPLTTEEIGEWGDPLESPESFDSILSWCPYASMSSAIAPPTLVVARLQDAKVPYWGPTKWVARRRALQRGSANTILLVQQAAGHAGPSSLNARYDEAALTAAFALNCVASKREDGVPKI